MAVLSPASGGFVHIRNISIYYIRLNKCSRRIYPGYIQGVMTEPSSGSVYSIIMMTTLVMRLRPTDAFDVYPLIHTDGWQAGRQAREQAPFLLWTWLPTHSRLYRRRGKTFDLLVNLSGNTRCLAASRTPNHRETAAAVSVAVPSPI